MKVNSYASEWAMLNRLRQDLLDLVLQKKSLSAHQVSAANRAFQMVLQTPYFEGAHQNCRLLQSGPTYAQLVWFDDEGDRHSLDPLEKEYSDAFYEGGIPRPTAEVRLDEASEVSDLPSSVEQQAHTWVSQLRARHPVWDRLWDEDAAQLMGRHVQHLEHFDSDLDLHERLTELLGPHYDLRLKEDGIQYHHPSLSPFLKSEEIHHAYILVHNQHEVMGLTHYLAKKHEHGLSFVSVPPAFRRRGLGTTMYLSLIEKTHAAGKILVRSRPGEFARKNPGITRHYDELLRAADLLHVRGGNYFHAALVRSLERHPYAQVHKWAVPLCHRASQMSWEDSRDSFENQLAQELESRWVSSRPRPR